MMTNSFKPLLNMTNSFRPTLQYCRGNYTIGHQTLNILFSVVTRILPPFKNVKDFLEFACHGEHGLHGYTKMLRTNFEATLLASIAAITDMTVLKLQSLLSTKEGRI